ncbi:MAG: hypothetical protein WCW01_04095 [Gammaproteobacteria bacterium]
MNNLAKLNSTVTEGGVYRREVLLPFSKAIDRDLANLVKSGHLEKLSGGLYYKPQKTRYGNLPPNEGELIKAFLRDDYYLRYSWNDYNKLGLGLTQNYNRQVVYNQKRHGLFLLGSTYFDFRRPARGFPIKLTTEFLLVDLVNNLNELAEDSNTIKENIKKNYSKFKKHKVMEYVKKYGKIATRKFFAEITT